MSETKQAWKGLGGAMKKVWAASAMPIVVVLIIIGAALALGYRHFTQAAVVNGSVISRFDVIKELENSSGQAALEGLVTKKLITQAAVKAGIKVSSSDIDADVKDIEDKIAAQGSTLDAALEQQGMTRASFREQVTLQKSLEKLLADKVSVSDDDVKRYIESTKVKAPEGTSEEDFKAEVKKQLTSQKLGVEASNWIAEQKKEAKIQYFVPYAPKVEVEPAAETTPAPADNNATTSAPQNTEEKK